MDLQKDEDFEKSWQENRHVWESTKNLAKAMFYAGQTKAQAIPEGFVVVPKEPTQKMLDATINLAIPAVYVDSISGQHKLKVAAYYKAMINKAQEQANESN